MKIVLVGYMGSGKSVVGKQLSDRLNLPFKDLDTEIESTEGLSIPQIFAEKGEIYFRKLENRTLKNLLALKQDFVLATGGGTPCYADSLTAMLQNENTVTIYLKPPLNVLVDRLFLEREKRPLLEHLETKEQLMEYIGIHVFERSHFYNRAGKTIEVGTDSPENVANRITEAILK